MDSDKAKVRVGDIVQIFNDCTCPMCCNHDIGVVTYVTEGEVKIKFMSHLLENLVDTIQIEDLRVIGRVDDE